MLRTAAKQLAERVLSPSGFDRLRAARAAYLSRDARRAFHANGNAGAFLPTDQIASLQAEYPVAPPYHYDPDALMERGIQRSLQLARFSLPHRPRVLELAGHDAMVSGILARNGAAATAIDLSTDHVDPRAIAFGVEALAANAEGLPFDDGTFDCIFSYNAFEHFPRPRIVLKEALRVCKPGGLLFFSFGPLYRSSYGLHAMHSITIPFCQYLWQRSDLDAYISRHALGRIEYETLNEWTIRQCRALWSEQAHLAVVEDYREIPSLHGVDLIARYPACFRGKVDDFDDLLNSIVEIAMRRRS